MSGINRNSLLIQSSSEFIGHLRRLGIDIGAKDGKLLLNAPAGTLTEELQQELRRRKPELLVLLPANNGAEEERIAPLTFAQQRLWLIDRFLPGSPAYNIPQSWIVDSVDMNCLRVALERLAERHSAMRTCIETRMGDPVQVVMKRVEIPLLFSDLSFEDDGTNGELEVQRLLIEEGRRPFALNHAPLIRFHVFQLTKMRYLISYNVHHIIADQWSLDILKRDLAAFYIETLSGKASELPKLSMQYADRAERERSATTSQLYALKVEYWRERLKGMPTLLELPFSKSRPAEQGHEGATLSVVMDANLTAQLRELAARNHTSLYLLMLSIFAVLLYRYTGQKDLCVGTPITGRKLREEEDVFGFFVNMLPLRCAIEPKEPFEGLLKRVNEIALMDFEYGDVPFQRLVTELHPQRSSSHSPLFQIMFALNARGVDKADAQRETFIGVSKFDLTLQIAEQAHTMDAYFEYRTELFSGEDIERFGRHFVCLAESIVESPRSEVRGLALLTQDNRDAYKKWNATDLPFDTRGTLVSLFEQQVRRCPDAVALCHEQRTYSFSALDEQANLLAAWLHAEGISQGNFVALCLDRTPELIVSMLGTLKVGAAYLPLDPKYPEERLSYMLKDSETRILITQRSELSARLAEDHPNITVLFVEDGLPTYKRNVDVPLNMLATPEGSAYLIYTSGSTGKPKGVIVEHRNAVALITWARTYFDNDSLSGVLASTSICFDLSIFEIFVPLSTGNAIVLVDDLLQLPTAFFADKVTLINTVPSAMNALLHVGLSSSLRTVCMAGEFLPTELVNRVYGAGVGKVFDLYGPTETTTYSTCTLRMRDAAATIGMPIANTRIYLLDENLAHVPLGAQGEIFIGGAGVTRGYLDRPELTEERFVSIPQVEPRGRLYRTGDLARQRNDGEIVYLGRLDQQIKLRGHRIELGEVEAALREVSGVSQLAVVVQKRDVGDTLVAFVTRIEKQPNDARDWTAALRKRLPAYMIPTFIVFLAAMPLTPNGKIDRKALSISHKADSDGRGNISIREAPRDLLEQWVANVWAHRLGLKYVARDAHFFEELGGHSLVAFEIFAEIETRLGVAMMLATLLQAPTVELLAVAIRRQGWKAIDYVSFIMAGSAERVIYLVGEAVNAQFDSLRIASERVMSVGSMSEGVELEGCVREIAVLEAARPALLLVGTNTQWADVQRLAARLSLAGFSSLESQFLELR